YVVPPRPKWPFHVGTTPGTRAAALTPGGGDSAAKRGVPVRGAVAEADVVTPAVVVNAETATAAASARATRGARKVPPCPPLSSSGAVCHQGPARAFWTSASNWAIDSSPDVRATTLPEAPAATKYG